MNPTVPLAWESGFLHRSPLFEPLCPVGGELSACADWPTLVDLQRAGVANQAGKPIRFVPPHDKPQRFEDEYEQRTFLAGEVQTRPENWHDLFNALVWLAFPKSKAEINARHYAEILRERESAAGKSRGKLRDRLTQFDESGMVILCADAQLSQLLADHQWQRLFWHERERVAHAMRFLVFGHSLYEKALQPYPGITGKALVLPVAAQALDRPVDEVVALADDLLAEVLADSELFGADAKLQPLPLMGIPGWTPENEDAAYYEDARYFRPRRC
jgi:hypothetical protein